MTRWIAASAGALALALALGIAMPLGNEAAADGMKAPVYSVPTKKRCIAPAGFGFWNRGPVTWICAASERCCYDRVLRRGNCIAATDRCF